MSTAGGQQTLVLEKTARWQRASRTQQPTSAVKLITKHKRPNDKPVTYAIAQQLYALWTQYFAQLDVPAARDDRVATAAYHGALLLVTHGHNPSQTGLSGIVVRETKHTFVLCTTNDQCKTLPKAGSVFSFVHGAHVYTLYGDALLRNAAARLSKKKRAVPLPYLLR